MLIDAIFISHRRSFWIPMALVMTLWNCDLKGGNRTEEVSLGAGELRLQFTASYNEDDGRIACGVQSFFYEVSRCGNEGEIIASDWVDLPQTGDKEIFTARSVHIPILDEDGCDCAQVRVKLESEFNFDQETVFAEACEGKSTEVNTYFECLQDEGAEGEIVITIDVKEEATPFIEIDDFTAVPTDCQTPIETTARVTDRDSDLDKIELYVKSIHDAQGNPLPEIEHNKVQITFREVRDEEAIYLISISPNLASSGGKATIYFEAMDAEGNASDTPTPVTIYSDCKEEENEKISVKITSHKDGDEVPQCFLLEGLVSGVLPQGPPFLNVFVLADVWYAQNTATINGNNWKMDICVGASWSTGQFTVCAVVMEEKVRYPTTFYELPEGVNPEATHCIEVYRE